MNEYNEVSNCGHWSLWLAGIYVYEIRLLDIFSLFLELEQEKV